MGKGARYVSRHTHTHSQRPLLRIQRPEAHGRFGVRCFYAPFSVPSQCPCKMPARANLADTRGICECNQGPLVAGARSREWGPVACVAGRPQTGGKDARWNGVGGRRLSRRSYPDGSRQLSVRMPPVRDSRLRSSSSARTTTTLRLRAKETDKEVPATLRNSNAAMINIVSGKHDCFSLRRPYQAKGNLVTRRPEKFSSAPDVVFSCRKTDENGQRDTRSVDMLS